MAVRTDRQMYCPERNASNAFLDYEEEGDANAGTDDDQSDDDFLDYDSNNGEFIPLDDEDLEEIYEEKDLQ